jgi:tetratricopeptide (TPR) repeat protein
MPAREALEDDPADADRLKDTVPDIASENDVVWLRDRGAHFFKHGDFIASVNAYTAALEFQPKNPQLLTNRAAAHFQLMAFTSTIADCSRAVQLLEKRKSDGVTEMSASDALAFGIALSRRGAAQLRLGMITDALSDLQRAVKLLPEDALLSNDFERVQELARASKVLPLKEAADSAFKNGEKERALELYNSAIAEDGGCFQLFSNRAACLASMQRHADAINDCNKALLILDPKRDGGDTRLALRLLVRRGASFVNIGNVILFVLHPISRFAPSMFLCFICSDFLRKSFSLPAIGFSFQFSFCIPQYDQAKQDYKRALAIEPQNEKLQHDYAMLSTPL